MKTPLNNNPRVTKIIVEQQNYFSNNQASKNQQDEWIKARFMTEIANMTIEISSKEQKIKDLEAEIELCKERIIKDAAPSN